MFSYLPLLQNPAREARAQNDRSCRDSAFLDNGDCPPITTEFIEGKLFFHIFLTYVKAASGTVGWLWGEDAGTKRCAEAVGDLEKLFGRWDQWGWHPVTFYGDLKEPVYALADAAS